MDVTMFLTPVVPVPQDLGLVQCRMEGWMQ